ncbi:alpha/beta fold hydrolase [Homoserinimonas sp. OAct 916]|uniref:alpha/beta fold hydrolase n=1 Tax=Homoserinimonas sp. OAct 916 TaxID=2211450 RepID=UPI001E63A568|nr:alpha/beta hydrolase [Homoserinimonas sp. OAct 916]
MNDYETFRVPVAGGELAGGVWNPTAPGPVVLAIHGITASHYSWPFLARALPTTRIIAPDLRGRARSNGLPGPYGLKRHADDMAALLDAFAVDDAVVVGHSMGAFVSVRLAERHPARVRSLVLVDGGLPIPRPANADPAAMLGPAADRLTQTFASRAEYARFWRRHPAFADQWSPEFEAYVDYDLDETDSGFIPSTQVAAVAEDVLQLDGSAGYAEALAAVAVPIEFLRAPRGLMNEPAALYAARTASEWDELPSRRVLEVPDVNHYTIIMSKEGARFVATVLRAHVQADEHGGKTDDLEGRR